MNKLPVPHKRRFRAVMSDKGIFCGRYISDMLIHCIISFDSLIDENRMAQAVKLAFESEPVLGSRFVVDSCRMYWER